MLCDCKHITFLLQDLHSFSGMLSQEQGYSGVREEEARVQATVSGANDTGCPPGMSSQSSFAVNLSGYPVVLLCFRAKGRDLLDSGGQSGTLTCERR